MGAFMVMLAVLSVALLALLNPFGTNSAQSPSYVDRPSLEAVAQNMVQVHAGLIKVAVPYCASIGGCSTAEANFSAGFAIAFNSAPWSSYIPGYLPVNPPMVDWRVYYNVSSGKVVTFYQSTTNVSGFSAQQVAQALNDLKIDVNHTTWAWGIIASGAVPNPTTTTLPTDVSVRTSWTSGWVAIVSATE